MELTPIQCQNCGAQLNINPGSEQVDCPFCGTAFAVKVSGSTIGLRRAAESLGRIDTSTSATAIELRIGRLQEEERRTEIQLSGKQELLARRRELDAHIRKTRSTFSFARPMSLISGAFALLAFGLLLVLPWEQGGGGSACLTALCGVLWILFLAVHQSGQTQLRQLGAEMPLSEAEIKRQVAALEKNVSDRAETIAELLGRAETAHD